MKKVSILTPCYNGEQYIDDYVKALLLQRYPNCQLIFMDDGSTDNTKNKILSYEEELRKNGIILEYHFHSNIGPGATIAEGIKYVNGDYLIWPDVDDVLLENSIINRVDFLENNSDYTIVRSNYVVSCEKLDNIIDYNATKIYKDKSNPFVFDNYLLSYNMWLISGCFMVRMKDFDEANPNRYIFPSRTGQNWQMLLPVLYERKCGYIDQPLYNYFKRSNSLSAVDNNGFERRINQLAKYEEIIVDTIKHMNIKEVDDYITKVHNHYIVEQIEAGFIYNNYLWARKNWINLPKSNRSIKIFLKYKLSRHKFIKKIFMKILNGIR